jgi:hypothetical protein
MSNVTLQTHNFSNNVEIEIEDESLDNNNHRYQRFHGSNEAKGTEEIQQQEIGPEKVIEMDTSSETNKKPLLTQTQLKVIKYVLAGALIITGAIFAYLRRDQIMQAISNLYVKVRPFLLKAQEELGRALVFLKTKTIQVLGALQTFYNEQIKPALLRCANQIAILWNKLSPKAQLAITAATTAIITAWATLKGFTCYLANTSSGQKLLEKSLNDEGKEKIYKKELNKANGFTAANENLEKLQKLKESYTEAAKLIEDQYLESHQRSINNDAFELQLKAAKITNEILKFQMVRDESIDKVMKAINDSKAQLTRN